MREQGRRSGGEVWKEGGGKRRKSKDKKINKEESNKGSGMAHNK